MDLSLIILAAGIGSRYGGLKQLDTFGPRGESIIDYSIYDAILNGFTKVILVIRPELEPLFQEKIIKHLPTSIHIHFAYQMPPAHRQKPWGTGEAVLAAKDLIQGSFAVINADDYYGPEAFKLISQFFEQHALSTQSNIFQKTSSSHKALAPHTLSSDATKTEMRFKEDKQVLVAYELLQTLSPFGPVSRGICDVSPQNNLISIREHTGIYEDTTSTSLKSDQAPLAKDALTSMNCWGFSPSFLSFLETEFETFYSKNKGHPSAEYYLPYAVDAWMKDARQAVHVLHSNEPCLSITYAQDGPLIRNKIQDCIAKGIYPPKLWT